MGNQLEVMSSQGPSTGTVELPDALFGVQVSEYAVHRAVVSYEANQRQGTASVKSRSEVRRTSKKHHRQKGTGWARRGSMRSPLVRGGGVAFGPQPRSYRTHMPKALKRLAFLSALTLKSQSGDVKVVDEFDFPVPSTKSFEKVMTACGVSGGKVLLVTVGHAPLLHRSCRNIPTVKMTPVSTLGAYDLIAADTVLFTRTALERLIESTTTASEETEARSTDS